MPKKHKLKKLISTALAVSALALCVLPTQNVFAAGNLAFSVGCNYGTGNINTSRDATKSCDYYALCGFSSRYTTQPTLTTLKGSYNGTKFMEADVIMLSGHGNSGGIQFKAYDTGRDLWVTTNTSATNSIILQNYKLSNVKLLIFDGCETAKETSNCAKIVVDSGCKASIGWTTTVGVDSMYDWKVKFNNYLATGNSIDNAIKIANSFNYGDNSCKNYKRYGNGAQVLKHAKSAVYNEALEAETKVQISTNKDLLMQKSYIEDILSSTYDNYNFGDFRIDTAFQDDANGTITIVEQVGEFATENAYVLMLEDGVITSIFDRTVSATPNTYSASGKSASVVIDKSYIMRLASDAVPDELTVEEQKVQGMIDNETGERYYMVYSTVTTSAGGKSVLSYKYVID